MGLSLKERVESLTDAEVEVLALAARHFGSKQIADQLGCSAKTVDNRISRAMKRLGVSNRDSAIRLLIEAAGTPWGKSLATFSSLAVPPPPSPPRVLSRFPWPWPTEWRPENDHEFTVKLLMTLALATVMMLVVILYISTVILIDGWS